MKRKLVKNIQSATYVAPHAGAWIETPIIKNVISGSESHPTRVRGLKHPPAIIKLRINVAPHAGAWIETKIGYDEKAVAESHPTRVRGLKLANDIHL